MTRIAAVVMAVGGFQKVLKTLLSLAQLYIISQKLT